MALRGDLSADDVRSMADCFLEMVGDWMAVVVVGSCTDDEVPWTYDVTVKPFIKAGIPIWSFTAPAESSRMVRCCKDVTINDFLSASFVKGVKRLLPCVPRKENLVSFILQHQNAATLIPICSHLSS